MPKTLISPGDLIDVYYKISHRGYYKLWTRLKISGNSRTVSKWNATSASSDFWIIPEVRLRWNEKCSGDPDLEYEDYLHAKYFAGQKGLRLLSIGCGTGSKERKYAKYPEFELVEGIDLASNRINTAEKDAIEAGLSNIRYHTGDFRNYGFEKKAYDIILFNSSLHHFDRIDKLLRESVLPLLKDEGYLIIFEYVGPSRLQWTRGQLELTNTLLKELPSKYRTRSNGRSKVRRAYRPGLIRMRFVDPSEAIDSASIMPAIHRYFNIIEEKNVGWNITHLLFKDIAHNFLSRDEETQGLLKYIFQKEDEFIESGGTSDAVFGLYRKKNETT